MQQRMNLAQVAIVLNEPQIPENIGSAARAMHNMGIRDLIVVSPKNYDLQRIHKMATQAAREVVERILLVDSLAEGLGPFGYVVGTTARLGGQRVVRDPAGIAEKLVPISHENRIAVVFGREDRGMSNADLRLCHELVTIPTQEFSSLNLAQAVMVLCYEFQKAARKEGTPFKPRLANRFELDGMYDGLKDVLVKISYLNPENPDYWIDHIRKFFTRIELRAREVSIIRGLIRQVNWYGETMYRQGCAEGQRKLNDKENSA